MSRDHKRRLGLCLSCPRKATRGTRCDECAETNRVKQRARDAARRVSVRVLGLDGKMHNRCGRCGGAGHNAKTCEMARAA